MGKVLEKSEAKKTGGECIVDLPLTELYPPEYHPFQIIDDTAI